MASRVKTFDDAWRILTVVRELLDLFRRTVDQAVSVFDFCAVVLVLHLVLHDLLEDLAVGVLVLRIIGQLIDDFDKFFD